MDFNLLKKIIVENDSFLLTTHVNPDADAIGSEIALHNILKKLRKEVNIVNHSYTPYNLVFLDSNNVIQKFSDNTDKEFVNKADVLVALDFNRSNRLVSMEKIFSE